MKRHVNLMSRRARVHSIVRTRIRQWAVVYACTVAIIAPLLFATRWPVYQESLHVASLEAQYEPIRQLRLASHACKKQIKQVHAKEQTSLALAKIDTPVVTLLGLIGKAVTDSEGSIVVEEFNFDQDITLQDTVVSDAKPIIEIQGYGKDENAVSQLTNSLQAALPFGKVELEFSELQEINQHKMYRFNIHCSL